MLLPGENSPKFWFFVTILVSTIIAFTHSSGAKTLNIKLGFDLTQGSNGAPSLRIRDFKESAEYNPRAVDDASSSDSSSKKTSPRADSSESEEQEHPKKEESSKEKVKPPKSSGSSDDDDDDNNSASREEKLRSTRGLKAADFEPEEENPKIHGRYQKYSASENSNSNEEGRRRYRRHIGKIRYRKSK